MCLSHSSASVPTVSPTTSSSSSLANGNSPWKLSGCAIGRAAASLKHTTRCMSLRTCTCKWPHQRTISILLPSPAALTSDVTCFRGARRRIPHALSHGHRQPSCAIYENKRTPPSGHAWHPPGWRQFRVSCSALSPFSCFRGGRCVPGDRTLPFSRV